MQPTKNTPTTVQQHTVTHVEPPSVFDDWFDLCGTKFSELADSIKKFKSSIQVPLPAKKQVEEPGIITKAFRSLLHDGFQEKKCSDPGKVGKLLDDLGNQTVELTTKYNETSWVKHLTADSFAEKMTQAGGAYTTFTSKKDGKTLHAIELDTNKSSSLLKALTELNILEKLVPAKKSKKSWSLWNALGFKHEEARQPSAYLPGAWKQVQAGSKIYLIDAQDEDRFNALNPLAVNKRSGQIEGINSDNVIMTRSETPIQSGNKSTVILSGGAHSKIGSQAMAAMAVRYLVFGVNVVLVDDKQVQESETQERMIALRETTGEYLKSKCGLSNKDIIWHGICYSAPMAARMAKSPEFKGSGLIFDQGYEDGKEFFKQSIKAKLPGYLTPFESLVDREIDLYVNENPELFRVERNFDEIEGNVLMIVNHYDRFLSHKTTDSLVKSMFKSERVDTVANLTNSNLAHGQAWYLDPTGGATSVHNHLYNAGIAKKNLLIQA